MVKQSIQYYFLNKKNISTVRKSEYVELENIRKVAILFDYSIAKEKLIRDFILRLSESNIYSSTASYLQIEADNILKEDIVYFRDTDFNVIGVTKDIALNRFLEEEYDVLFDLRENVNIVSDYIHRSVKRKFSVGNNIEIDVNDITFGATDSFTSFSKNIIEYLRNLKKA